MRSIWRCRYRQPRGAGGGLCRPARPALADEGRGADFAEPQSRPVRACGASGDAEIASRAAQVAAYAARRDLPSQTKDGVRISLNLNLGLFVHAEHLAAP